MSTITPLNTTKECFDTLMNLYGKKAPSQNMGVNNKLQNLNKDKDKIVASFFTNIFQVRDHLGSIRVVKDQDDLLQASIHGLPSSWETFLDAVNCQKDHPNFQ